MGARGKEESPFDEKGFRLPPDNASMFTRFRKEDGAWGRFPYPFPNPVLGKEMAAPPFSGTAHCDAVSACGNGA